METEAEIISWAKAGNRHAFQLLYNKHVGQVYALCLRITANKQMAEDASQEVFIVVWRKLSSFDHQAKFSTWLHSVTANTTISYLRKHKNWLQKVVSIEDKGMTPQQVAMCRDLNGLDKLILRLPERARHVFVLHAVEGYRHDEIAELLDMAVGSSKSQYHRARNLLQSWWHEDIEEATDE